jgi:hypothetical protein
MLPGRVAEPSTLEHLRQLTGVEQPAQQNLLDQLAQLTGAQSPDSVPTHELLQQLSQGGLLDGERAGHDPGLSKEYPEPEQTPGIDRTHEGVIHGHDETSKLFERTQDKEQTREQEIVHDIAHDSFSR